MKNSRILLSIVLIFISFSFAGQIGPWSHFRAIRSDFTVNLGDTLTINAGTEVRFSPGTIMNVYGVVKSNGTTSDPVIFAALDPSNPTWGGITIINSTPGEVSVFNSTIFTRINSYGDGAISIGNSNVDFNNCKFLNNHADYNGGAVYVVAGNLNFNSCVFKENNADLGGALFVFNNSSTGPSTIEISDCVFFNNTANNGGGIYIDDYDGALDNMTLILESSGIYNNIANSKGGGIFYNCLSHIDLKFKYSKIQHNDAFSGGGVYAQFNEMFGGDVLHQEFANLLITGNSAFDAGGFYLSTGFTQNPANIDFINTTIAYNELKPSKEVGGGGIHIVSNGNYPIIKNSIIWGNGTDLYLNQFLITDDTFPAPAMIFEYCDIDGGSQTGPEGLSVDPKFVRAPFSPTNTLIDADRFDYHLSINSPCIDTGDPETPINALATPEMMYPPFVVNMGAYGNTRQAAVPLNSIIPTPAGTVTDLNIPDGGVVVLDFEGKAKDYIYDLVHLGLGSELHLLGSNLATIKIKELSTPIRTFNKLFNDERIVIQKVILATDLGTKPLNISEKAILYGVEMSDMQLNIAYDPTSGGINPIVDISNSKIFTSDLLSLASGISVTEAQLVNIVDTKIDNFLNGIEVINSGFKGSKASSRITNNTVTFNPSASSKAGQQIGIQIQNSDSIIVEDNDIENGDIGIQMSNSGGRITNNTVSFNASASSKNKLFGKIAVNVIAGTNAIIEDNDIFISDSISPLISAINVDLSSAQISYNKINFHNPNSFIRNGVVLNEVLDNTYAYNNTIYNPTNGINNTAGFSRVDFINNIIWNDDSDTGSIDTTGINFYNNDIKTLGDITGNDNISSDPLCIYPSRNDLVINPDSSACMNAGKIISDFHVPESNYFGIAPEIGAVEYYEIELAAPGEVTVGVTDSTFTFGWGSVSGASSYTVYSSDDPYAAFDSVATVFTTSWETSIVTSKKFFYVIANDPSKNVMISDEPRPYSEIKIDENNTVIKKRIPKKIRRTSSDR